MRRAAPLVAYHNQVSARKLKRCAWDGKLYTIREFQDHYGEKAAESLWESAPHFNFLREFCTCFHLQVVRSAVAGLDTWASSAALFGLWVPCCVLLLDVHHLEGKLKGSRLAPEGWRTDIWDASWKIGNTDNTMMVLDFCTELYGSEDPLGELGRTEMVHMLQEFNKFMEGVPPDWEHLERNHLMRFLSVSVGARTT